MPAWWAALRASGTSASTRSFRASSVEWPNIFAAAGFQRTMRWDLASATITASLILSKSLPKPRSSGLNGSPAIRSDLVLERAPTEHDEHLQDKTAAQNRKTLGSPASHSPSSCEVLDLYPTGISSSRGSISACAF